jgi:hypothetical protein
MISIRGILLLTLFAIVAIFSILGYDYSIHSSSNPQLPYIFLVQTVVGTVGLMESIIRYSYKDYTKDSYFKQKWRNFIIISTPIILIYIVASVIVATVFKSITTLLEISLLYVVIMSTLYVKVLRR